MCNKRNYSDQEHVPAVLSRREALKAGAAAANHVFLRRSEPHRAATEAAYGSAARPEMRRWNG